MPGGALLPVVERIRDEAGLLRETRLSCGCSLSFPRTASQKVREAAQRRRCPNGHAGGGPQPRSSPAVSEHGGNGSRSPAPPWRPPPPTTRHFPRYQHGEPPPASFPVLRKEDVLLAADRLRALDRASRGTAPVLVAAVQLFRVDRRSPEWASALAELERALSAAGLFGPSPATR